MIVIVVETNQYAMTFLLTAAGIICFWLFFRLIKFFENI